MDQKDVLDAENQLRAIAGPSDELSPTQARTRQRVLTAASELFPRFGYRRTNMADVANEAGVGKGTVYLYFASKVELLWACVAQEKLALVPQLEEVQAQPADQQLEAYLRMTIRYALTAPLSRALMQGDKELAAALADAEAAGLGTSQEHGLAQIAAMVADAAPGIAEDQRDLLAQVLAMAVSLPAHLSTMQEHIGLSNEDFIITYARTLARGVAAHQPEKEAE